MQFKCIAMQNSNRFELFNKKIQIIVYAILPSHYIVCLQHNATA